MSASPRSPTKVATYSLAATAAAGAEPAETMDQCFQVLIVEEKVGVGGSFKDTRKWSTEEQRVTRGDSRYLKLRPTGSTPQAKSEAEFLRT